MFRFLRKVHQLRTAAYLICNALLLKRHSYVISLSVGVTQCCPSHQRNMTSFYEGDELAEKYEVFRPGYPVELVSEVLKFLDEQNPGKKRRGFMLDVGCGGGLATRLFAPYFEKVMGIDISASQINMAKKTVPNVEFKIGSASDLPVESGSVDLVIAGTAAHYFDFDVFLPECDRILLPGGCVALFVCLPCLLKTPQRHIIEGSRGKSGIINQVMRFFREVGMSATAVDILENDHKSIYDRIQKTCKTMARGIEMDKQFTVDKFISYLGTTGEYCVNKESFGDIDPLQAARNRLVELLGFADDTTNNESSFIATFEYPIVLFRK